jgi:hypothetical protein
MKTDMDPIAEAFRAAISTVVEPAIDAPTWEVLAERAAVGQPEPASRRQSLLRRPAVVAAVAAVVVLVAIGGALLLVGSGTDPAPPADSTPSPAPTTSFTTTVPEVTTTQETAMPVPGPTEPETVFAWNGDDLSEWVTEAEMTAVLRDVVSRYADAVLDAEARFDREAADVGGDEGSWVAGDWQVHFHNGDHDGRYVGPPPETDPRLPEGVTYEWEWGFGWGNIIFSGPNSDEMIALSLRPPGTSQAYPRGSEAAAYRDMLFALAPRMLREMGWLDSGGDVLAVPSTEPDDIPIRESRQILYGAGDIGCPHHWAHDQSLPVGSVEFAAGEGLFTVVVELSAAAPNSEYGLEVLEPEDCEFGAPALFEGAAPRTLTTDGTGAGRIEFVVEDVDPGIYRLNVNLVHNDWEDAFPDADDTRLWEIGGAGFSLVAIP